MVSPTDLKRHYGQSRSLVIGIDFVKQSCSYLRFSSWKTKIIVLVENLKYILFETCCFPHNESCLLLELFRIFAAVKTMVIS